MINYKKFAIFFVSINILFILLLWLWAGFGKDYYMDTEYPLWKYKEFMLTNCQTNNKRVILGDSRPMSDVVPSAISDDTLNLAIGGVTPVELYKISLYLNQCSGKPVAIFISIAPFHFMAMESYWGRTLSFHFLNYHDSTNVVSSAQTDSTQTIFKRGRLGYYSDLIKSYSILSNNPFFYYTKLFINDPIGNYKQNFSAYQNLVESRGQTALVEHRVVTQPSAEVSLGSFKPWPLLDHYFDITLDELDRINVPVYILDMPISKLTSDGLPPNYKTDYSKYIKTKIKFTKNIKYIGEVLPVLDTADFSDPFHLHQDAAEFWTRKNRELFIQ